MARKRNEAVVEAAKPVQELDTLPGETFGLAVTSPPETSANIPANEADLLPAADDEGIDPDVSDNISDDPATTPIAAVAALGKIYNDAGRTSVAISSHLRSTAGEPELHAFLMRMQMLLGEFRHSFEQIDENMSETLRSAIQDAAAAA